MLTLAPCPEIRLAIAMRQFNLGFAALLTAEEVVAILLVVFFSRQDVLRTDLLHSISILIERETNDHYIFFFLR